MREQPTVTVPRAAGWLLTLGGLIGLIASFVLTVDKIHLLEDPSYVPGCSINANFSCGSVMTSWQASLFGFPNSLIGLVGFAVVVTLGVLALTGVALPRWVWWGLQFGALAAVVFVHWLMVQSIFDIEALCLYCMAVWTVTIPIFVVVTAITVVTDPARADAGTDDSWTDDSGTADDREYAEAAGSAVPALPRLLWLLPVVWLLAIAGLIAVRFV